MRVLLTGCTGFIGRHVVAQLLTQGHQVVAVVRQPEKLKGFSWGHAVEPICHDIHAPEPLDMRRAGKVDMLVHLAWPGLPNYTADFHFEENLPADCRFIKALLDQGLQRVLVTGTCLEYGKQGGCLAEDCPTNPVTMYALAKDALRKYLQSLQEASPFTLQWARLFYMYGDGQNPHSILAQLDKAIETGEKTFNMSGGEQLRDYLPVETVADTLVSLAEHQATGIFNICSGRPISIRRLVEEHLEKRQASIRLNLGHYPYADHEPMAFWGNSHKFDSLKQSALR